MQVGQTSAAGKTPRMCRAVGSHWDEAAPTERGSGRRHSHPACSGGPASALRPQLHAGFSCEARAAMPGHRATVRLLSQDLFFHRMDMRATW